MSKLFKFATTVREVRIHLCQKSASSAGVRSFIEKHYVDLKRLNPTTPILIRECSDIEPKLWTRHELGKEKNLSLTNMNDKQVLNALENIAK
jgi:NADH dehydrogenase (ubiquinone) 1 alpha subcomplex subunit 2